MRINQSQIHELWKIKMLFYGSKTIRAIWSTFLIPLLFMIVPLGFSGFRKSVISACAISFSLYVCMTLIIVFRLNKIKKSRYRERFSYLLTALLFSIYEIALLSMIFASLWTTVVYTSQKIFNTQVAALISTIFALFSAIVLVGMIVISPVVLNYKSLDRPDKSKGLLPIALAISGILPSMAILISATLSRSGKVELQVYLMLALSLLMSMLLLPIIVLNLYEILLLGMRKWPIIKKSGTKFEIVND
ncbi:MAG: hypothetical protein U0Z26_14560 [Anaerolineales bacterium]